MNLYIDTSNHAKTSLCLKNGGKEIVCCEFANNRDQSERLLPAIDDLIKGQGLTLKNLQGIFVNSRGDSFSSLRIGIITANTLAFALGIPVRDFSGQSLAAGDLEFVVPSYDREPNITISKKAIK